MGASWAQVGPTTTKALDTPGGAQQNRCTIDLKLSAPSVVQASFRSTQPPSVLRERLFRPEDPTQFFSQELLAQSCYARAASSRGARGEEAMPLGVSGIASGVQWVSTNGSKVVVTERYVVEDSGIVAVLICKGLETPGQIRQLIKLAAEKL